MANYNIKKSLELNGKANKSEIELFKHFAILDKSKRWQDRDYYVDEYEKYADEMIKGAFGDFLNFFFRRTVYWYKRIESILTTDKFNGEEYLLKYGYDDCTSMLNWNKTEINKVVKYVNDTGSKSSFSQIYRKLYPKKAEKTKSKVGNIDNGRDTKIKKLERENKKLKEEIKSLQKENEGLRSKIESIYSIANVG